MDLLLMFIMLWRDLERPSPTLHHFLAEQAEGHTLNFSRHVIPTPDNLSRGYVQGLCVCQDFQMSSNPSTGANPTVPLEQTWHSLEVPCMWCAHSHCIWCGWGSCACALLWISTSIANWMWPKHFGLTLHVQTICAAHVPLGWWCSEGWTQYFYHTAPGVHFSVRRVQNMIIAQSEIMLFTGNL